MPSVAGKLTLVRVSTTSGGAYSTVLGMKSVSHPFDAAMLDDSEFGVSWVQRIQGLKDGKISLSGQRRADDTTGQNIIRTSFLNDSDLFVQVLPDGTNGYRQQMRVTKWQIEAQVDGIVNLQIEMEGVGAPVAVGTP